MKAIVFTCRGVPVRRDQEMWRLIKSSGRGNNLGERANAILLTMPSEGHRLERVYFFKPDASFYGKNGMTNLVSPSVVSRLYEELRLRPDPYAQAGVHLQNPACADKYPNVCQWGPGPDEFSYIVYNTSSYLRDSRIVEVGRDSGYWHRKFWYCGVRA